MGFAPVNQQPDFVALEHAILARWQERDVFRRSVAARADGPDFRFYEGPPTANGRPGVHHVEARVFKDLFPRYRTMKGFRVPRKAGWDCHGIPVEIAVEKELGFTRKQDIEDFGVAAFNARCRQSVLTYVDEWNQLTQRIGFWVDLEDAYFTMSPSYVDSVWWSLRQLWDADLLFEGHRVVPYCPRCGTALSDHEVAQGYATTDDPSVHVRFPITEGPLAEVGAALLVWTTTPWTLISNTAVAIGADIAYVVVRPPDDEQLVVMAADLVAAVLGDGAHVERTVSADELFGLHYRGPFDYLSVDSDWRYVTVADFVTTTDGTGIVHLAPAFGADDMAVAREHDLPVVNPVDTEGKFTAEVTDFAGQFVKDADPHIIAALRDRGVLYRAGTYTHTYPFCWRCSTPLLYYATPSWYVATTKMRDRLLEVNAQVDWHPEHIRDGRFGDWLSNNVDWALSRTRYWGTPLPIWRCADCNDVRCVGSMAELGELAGRDLDGFDPHRPYVDDITLDCASCDGRATRVTQVIDAWYDSGSMPFAQLGYPWVDGSVDAFTANFPADFIAEAIDQTRGWFYSLMAVSTLLFDANSYRSVLCLGHIVDADGRKMSKSVGNVIDPWELIAAHGADPLRWLLLTEGSPWIARRVGAEPVEEVVRKFLLTLWNTYYFFVTYARIDGWTPAASTAGPPGERPVMDRWILAELAALVTVVDTALDGFDATTAGRAIATFVDDLSNWYVRRSRGRFWRSAGTDDADKDAAFATLHECLVTAVALMAPFVPFLTDELYENLVRSVDALAPDSVHLLDFPVADDRADDPELRGAMTAARQVVELGRRARQDAGLGTRQPLRAALVTLPQHARDGWSAVADVVAEELNVKSVTIPSGDGDPVTRRLKPNFRALGPKFGARAPAVAAAISSANGDDVHPLLARDGAATISVDGDAVTVTADMVTVIEESRTGWQVTSSDAFSVALDLELTADLLAEGLARDLVRSINDLRKRRGLELNDRIEVEIAATGLLVEAIEIHRTWIAGEVLATQVLRGAADDGEPIEVGHEQARIRLVVAQ